ncbi:MAG TPA: M1 family metallopeptidase, partial [Candidatus Eisenbacteria bacterium]|nr:M1 family metallopeptidase [Candidatus Eisenbacteria bacterium]
MTRKLCLAPLLLLVASLLAPSGKTPAEAADPPTPALRLPPGVRPTHYAVDLAIDPSQATFTGSVAIDLKIDSTTSFLWLHGEELEIKSASVTTESQEIQARPVVGEDGFLGLAFSRPLAAGAATLRIAYAAPLDSVRSRGIYRVKEPDGAWYAYTFFEPVDARRAFPCFDEPSFKVPWRVTIRTRSSDVAVANAAVAGAPRDENGGKTWEFAETKPLPSYLIAFVVGPFDIVNAGTAGNHKTPLRFVIPRGRANELRYAREATSKAVGLLEDFFGMPIPYGKLDVAVPPRYWGTMEHPGIVAMGQPLTLIKPSEESFRRKESYANILIHELSHYWFGDYVTLEWWDETWLNESLATWMDRKITDQFEPSWRYRMESLNANASAMSADALVSTKAIRQPVTTRTDIESSFDGAITYYKGSQVLEMFEKWIGPEAFRRGILRFLRDHAHGTAVATDLLKALDAESGRDVTTPFLTFLDQPGVPLVSASLKCEAGRPARLELSQKRYLPEGSTGSANQTWQIPIAVRYGMGKDVATARALLSQTTGEIELSGVKGCPDWVVVNDGVTGYYHVKYEGDLRLRLQKRASVVLSPAERATLLADVHALVAANQMPVGEALDLVPVFVGDPDRFVFSGAMELFGWADRDFLPEALLPNFDRAVVKLLGQRAQTLGWKEKKGESNDARVLRPRVLPAVAIYSRGGPLATEGRRLADRWMTDRKGVDPDLIGSVLRVAAAYADRGWFDRCVAEARRTTDLQDRRRILSGLGNVRDPALTPDVLGLLLDDSFDLRDTQVLMFQTLANRETRDVAYEWVKAHYDAVFPRLREDEQSRFMGIPSSFCDAEHRKDAEAFFGPRAEKIDGGPQALRRSLE